MTSQVEAGVVLEQIMAFCRFRVIHSAVELDLFTALTGGSGSADEIIAAVGIHPRGAADLLDTLTALGLLEQVTDAGTPRYANSPAAQRFLVRGRPEYLGGWALLAGGQLAPLWNGLTDSLRTGEAQVDTRFGMLDGYRDADTARAFLDAMDSINLIVGTALAEQIDWSAHSSAVDLGGSRGNLAITLARAHPHLKLTCVDRPAAEPFFTEHVRRAELTDRVTFHTADFFVDELPRADVYIVGHILHYFDGPNRRRLLDRLYPAMVPGGLLVVYDRMIEDDRVSPDAVLALFGSLTMLMCSPGGREYTKAELAGWLDEAGFSVLGPLDVGPPDTVILARR